MRALVLTCLAVTSFAGTAVAQGSLPPLSKLRPRLDPAALPKLPAACVDGQSGWRDVAADNREAVLKPLKSLPWKERRYSEPDWDCRLELAILCAPDLDGDATDDFLVRLRWAQRTGAARKKACTELLADDPDLVRHEAVVVMSRAAGKGPPAWAALDVVSLTADSLDGMVHARVDFVQLPDGKVGLRCKTQTEGTGAGCQVTSFWVGALVGGRVQRLGQGDPAACKPD
jgi:hypothetical protein